MNKFKTSEIISIVSLMVSILIAAMKDDVDVKMRMILIIALAVTMLSYLAYIIVKKIRMDRSMTSTAIVTKARRYTGQLLLLVNANERRLKKYAYVKELRALNRRNKSIVRNCRDLKVKTDSATQQQLQNLHVEINDYFRRKSENYADLAAIKAYDRVSRVLESADSGKILEIHKVLVKGIFDIERILLQLEQHNTRIKLGKYVAMYAVSETDQIRGYIDLIGWTYILIGNGDKGVQAINNGINLIDALLSKKSPSLSESERNELLYLKARAYRHLGSTYYTYKYRHPIEDLEKSRAALEQIDRDSFGAVKYDKMLDGIKNNEWLCMFYDYIHKGSSCYQDIDLVENVLEQVESSIAEICARNDSEQDKHRLLKLYSLKSQITKALDVNGVRRLDMEEMLSDLREMENVLVSNIYFDDAMEVYINEKVQIVFENVRRILANESVN